MSLETPRSSVSPLRAIGHLAKDPFGVIFIIGLMITFVYVLFVITRSFGLLGCVVTALLAAVIAAALFLLSRRS